MDYETGLVDLDSDLQESSRARGAGWMAVPRPRVDTAYMPSATDLVVRTSNWATANKALHLINAGLHLVFGYPSGVGTEDFAAWCDEDPDAPSSSDPQFQRQEFATHGTWRGCVVAAKASRKTAHQYALSKYAFSTSLFALHVVDLDPRNGFFYPVSPFPADHIRFSHAVVAAHSAIEDLGLEVRASQSRPSRVNGRWNPPVKSDLEDRLLASGIDPADSLLWTLRGPRRRLDVKRPVPGRDKYPWSRGSVRDCRVMIVDAIAHVGWLRSKVAAHGSSELARSLSPYDVVNAQHVVRRLLLGAFGMWRPE